MLSVFVDYDGTITDLDTFDVLVRTYAGAHLWHALEQRLEARTMTLRDVLRTQAQAIGVSLDEADALLARETRFDPSFARFAAWCVANAVPLTVVSSGVQPLIERAFARNGLSGVPILANGIDPSPQGWRFEFRDDSDNGHDKAAAVRAARDAGAYTVLRATARRTTRPRSPRIGDSPKPGGASSAICTNAVSPSRPSSVSTRSAPR
ncbi:MAG TPA: HAD-IB family phosphatase [Candidatus Lustribacter sp.]